MKLYLDSNIFISSMRSEMGRRFSLLFHHSDLFFAECQKSGHIVALSGLFFDEVEKVISSPKPHVLETFHDFGVAFQILEKAPTEKQLASEISQKTSLHFSDAIHVALASINECDLIVTWNVKDFQKAEKWVPCATPKAFLGNF